MKVKSMITIIASVLASLVLLAGCSQPVSQSSLNAETDNSESRAVLGTPTVSPTNGATLVAGPFYDASRQIETRIYYKSVEGQWNTVAAAVGPEDILIGGGATVDYPGVWGAMLTGSFPQ